MTIPGNGPNAPSPRPAARASRRRSVNRAPFVGQDDRRTLVWNLYPLDRSIARRSRFEVIAAAYS